jgi:CRISPR type III-A-associated RAMP protein Csm4
MQPALVFRFRPAGPWRIGPGDGSRHDTDTLIHSDVLFSALTQAMLHLGWLEEWLSATTPDAGAPVLRLSSCFPYLDEVHLVAPPATLWPPAASPKLRWEGARFVPLALINDLLSERPLNEEAWRLDGPSECLLPADIKFSAPGPFRPARRWRAAVDRLGGSIMPYETGCLEFSEGGGFWGLAVFADEQACAEWGPRLRGALQLLADTGLGGERAQGWGHSLPPEFIEIEWPDTLLTAPVLTTESEGPGAWWLLSLFNPAADDAVDWPRSRYQLITRGGRVESPQGWGLPKKLLRMVTEGSVLCASGPLRGTARNVAPDGFAHPVLRYGVPLALRIGAISTDRPPAERTGTVA